MKFKAAVIFATALSLASFSAFAGKKAAAVAPKAKVVVPTLDQVLGVSGINVSGTVDMSYDLSSNDGSAAGGFTLHGFDVHPNSFVVHQLNFTISKQWSNGISLVVNPLFGEDANIINAGTTRGVEAAFGPVPATLQPLAASDFSLLQAYLQYTFDDLTVQAGKFVTLAGSELTNNGGNINASRSFLWTLLQPIAHVGVRGTFALCKNLSLTVGGVNGGATPLFGPILATDNNSGISLETQLAYTSSLFSTAFTFYTGDEATGTSGLFLTLGGNKNQVQLYDFVASVTPIDVLTLGLNADYRTTEVGGVAGNLYDNGIAGYANFKLTPRARIAVRGEMITIDGGGPVYNYGSEITATFGYSPLAGLELIAEARADSFNAPVFPNVSGLAGSTSKYQNTGTLKAIYKF